MVTTEGGKVEGENVRLGWGQHMDIFKGIPFADVPGRFEKPQLHPGWDGGWNELLIYSKLRLDLFSSLLF